MKSITPAIIAGAAVFILGACDSKEEQARKNALEQKADSLEIQADAARKGAEKAADSIESQKAISNAPGTNRELDKSADSTRKAGETAAEKLENQADGTREKK